ncbi:peroxisomal Membrane Protein 34 [Arctopsyche grandis]|uniref:peroxisomal Membrane Protein 34 n=1 Tax=Arctopsyche grandis TaxID=121162 RepID=UPI00406D7067
MSRQSQPLLSYDTLVHAIAGATGSVVGMATFYPLDTIRCRLQLEESELGKGGTLRALARLSKEEGVLALYRGVVPVLQSIYASNFVYFYTFHGLKSLNGGAKGQSAARDLLLGAIAGITNVLVTTPLWVVNTRLKMSGTPYKSLVGGLQHVAQTEGVRGLWAGTMPSLLLVANPAIQFMTYEALKRRFSPNGHMTGLMSLALGASAKAVATVITYPLQVVQARLRHRGQGAVEASGILPALLALCKRNGLRGLFRGLEAKLLQTVLMAALMFSTYEKITRFVLTLLHRRPRLALQ